MALSPIAAAANQPVAQQVLQPSGHHKHRGQSTASISDVDVQSSSVTPAGGAHAKPGSLLNITA
jgi:hypothetical protein